ncbi:MAG: hypothetical protein K2X29_05490 [Candidatus Obscuribacterales bacterium]|nr:hypothetical protein [Candidatus Obscuribacterales bacterium]
MKLGNNEPKRVEISGQFGSLTLVLRNPTFAEYSQLTVALANNDKEKEHDLAFSLIKSWEGVEDAEGKPLPYSLNAFLSGIVAYPDLYRETKKACFSVLYSWLDKTSEKN